MACCCCNVEDFKPAKMIKRYEKETSEFSRRERSHKSIATLSFFVTPS